MAKVLWNIDIEYQEIEVVVNSEIAYTCTWFSHQRGCIITLPFYSHADKENPRFEGYLIYHDKDGYGMTERKLLLFGQKVYEAKSPSGQAGHLSPLPYKPISADEIENAILELIRKNTRTDFSISLSL